MHFNYMTGEQWRIWHGISHRFPMWDKKDKHSALLLREQNQPWAVSRTGAACRSGGARRPHNAPCPAGATKWGNPGWSVCAGLPENVLIARGSLHTPAALSGGRGSCCLFFQGALRAGGDEGGLNWISPLFLDCCDSSEAGRTEVCFRVCVPWLSMTHLWFSRDTPTREIFCLGMAFLKQGENLWLQEPRAAEMLSVCSTLCCTSTGWLCKRGENPGITFPKQVGSFCCSSQETWVGERFKSFRRVQQERLENCGNAASVSG